MYIPEHIAIADTIANIDHDIPYPTIRDITIKDKNNIPEKYMANPFNNNELWKHHLILCLTDIRYLNILAENIQKVTGSPCPLLNKNIFGKWQEALSHAASARQHDIILITSNNKDGENEEHSHLEEMDMDGISEVFTQTFFSSMNKRKFGDYKFEIILDGYNPDNGYWVIEGRPGTGILAAPNEYFRNNKLSESDVNMLSTWRWQWKESRV